jgi:hypothetical protein
MDPKTGHNEEKAAVEVSVNPILSPTDLPFYSDESFRLFRNNLPRNVCCTNIGCRTFCRMNASGCPVGCSRYHSGAKEYIALKSKHNLSTVINCTHGDGANYGVTWQSMGISRSSHAHVLYVDLSRHLKLRFIIIPHHVPDVGVSGSKCLKPLAARILGMSEVWNCWTTETRHGRILPFLVTLWYE